MRVIPRRLHLHADACIRATNDANRPRSSRETAQWPLVVVVLLSSSSSSSSCLRLRLCDSSSKASVRRRERVTHWETLDADSSPRAPLNARLRERARLLREGSAIAGTRELDKYNFARAMCEIRVTARRTVLRERDAIATIQIEFTCFICWRLSRIKHLKLILLREINDLSLHKVDKFLK